MATKNEKENIVQSIIDSLEREKFLGDTTREIEGMDTDAKLVVLRKKLKDVQDGLI